MAGIGMRRTTKSPVIDVSIVYYPESDGRPMGETDIHRQAMIRHIELLEHYYEGQQVYVSGDLLVYYEQGNPKKFVVPDAFVAKGIAPGLRRIYKVWLEKKAPDVAIETTSRKTKRKDTIEKPALYARLGIHEYFLFDPTEEYLSPPLQGYRLHGADYQPIEPDAEGGLVSESLGLRLRFEKGQLAFYRLDTGERLLTAQERVAIESAARRKEAAARQREAELRQRETELRQAAEAEVARLREELRRRADGT
jgi:Uma2 family endonuclease